MVKLSKRIIGIITAAVVVSSVMFTSLPAYEAVAATTISTESLGNTETGILDHLNSNQVQTYQASAYGLTEKSKDGAILHAWCWSFNTIKENLRDIAQAGFSTVQTSPANNVCTECTTMKIMGSMSNGMDGAWWWQYQPTDWQIGNYQLGSEDEFKAMCAEADRYGVKIIVDVVPNHTTPHDSYVSQSLIDAAGGWDKLYHSNKMKGGSMDWNNRGDVVNSYGDLYDVETENPGFQAYFLNYCNRLIADGADGFRVDTAKHIGLPSDPVDATTSANGWRNNFWPVMVGQESANGVTMLKANQIFTYGEVLAGGNIKADEYSKYIPITDSNYGQNLRSAVSGKSFWADNIKNFTTAAGSNVVTWVESHDTYCNNGDSVRLSDWEIRMAWAVIAARKEGTPLFFSRPDGSNGWNNRWGNNVLGAKGNDQFKDPEVVAVNKFRNAMVGESENFRNINGSEQILSIERGNKGQVIINLGGDTQINEVTNLANGTYIDKVSGGTFTVSNGKISGTLKGGKITVLYGNPKPVSAIYASVPTGTFDTNSLSVTLGAKNVTNPKYSIDNGTKISYTDGTTISIGTNLANNTSTTLKLTATSLDGTTISETYTYTKKTVSYNAGCLYAKASGWGSTMYAYVYDESSGNAKSIAKWPGVQMKYDSENGRYFYQLPSEYQTSKTQIIFTDGTNQVPAAKQPGIFFVEGKALIFDGKDITVKEPTATDPLVAGQISTDKQSPQYDGTVIKIDTKSATGGFGGYKYKFEVVNTSGPLCTITASKDSINQELEDNATTLLQDYSTNQSVTWTPSISGRYTIIVTSKDSVGNTVEKTMNYLVSPKPILRVISFNTKKISSSNQGSVIKLSAVAQGYGTIKYKFIAVKDGKIVFSSPYSTRNYTTWNPKEKGTYTLYCKITDNTGTQASKTMRYKVTN